jgi:hypothetical protein
LELVFADCAADPACQSEFPDVKREFDHVLARFGDGPLHVTMAEPSTGSRRAVTLEREAYVERLRAMLYTTNGARFVPLVVHRAFLNDFLTFQAVASRFSLGANSSRGLYFSTTCAESVPFITDAEIAAETSGTFLGDRRARAHVAACNEWPRGSVVRDFTEPVRTDIPVALYSGDADGATPPWIADEAAAFFSSGVKIRASRTGHQIQGPCAWDLMTNFVKRPTVRDPDTSCASRLLRPPFATDVNGMSR